MCMTHWVAIAIIGGGLALGPSLPAGAGQEPALGAWLSACAGNSCRDDLAGVFANARESDSALCAPDNLDYGAAADAALAWLRKTAAADPAFAAKAKSDAALAAMEALWPCPK